MRKHTREILSAAVAWLLFISVTGTPGKTDSYDPVTSPVSAAERSLARRSNAFGLDLLQRLTAESSPDSNLMISPLSVTYALAMAYNGAGGKTQWQISRALRLPDMPDNIMNDSYRMLMNYFAEIDSSVSLDIANSVWYRPGVNVGGEFIDRMRRDFAAAVRELDFGNPSGVDSVNAWVADNTHDRIPNIIQPPLDPNIVMILVNAVYFNAPWSVAFDPERTRPVDFHLANGEVISCSMMRRSDEVQYAGGEVCDAVELLYGDGSYSMILVLPRPDQTVQELVQDLTQNKWDDLIASMSSIQMDLQVPRFSFSDDHGLNVALKAMGMEIPFTPEADFSRMVEGGGIWIDSVIHKAFIEVDEEGTEAAAATAVMMRKGLNRFSLMFDRPFLFAIRERESDAIMFIGRVADPEFEERDD